MQGVVEERADSGQLMNSPQMQGVVEEQHTGTDEALVATKNEKNATLNVIE